MFLFSLVRKSLVSIEKVARCGKPENGRESDAG